MDSREKRMAELLPMLTPEIMEQLQRMMERELEKAERQRKGIRQAVIHGSYADIEHGAKVIRGITFAGERENILEQYSNYPFALAGIAYTAGIAEGKQRERNRRRFAANKKYIMEHGKLPTE